MKKSKQIVLFLLYAGMFLSVIGLQTYAIRDFEMRQRVNFYTLIAALTGGLLFYLLMRGGVSDSEKADKEKVNTERTGNTAEAESLVGRTDAHAKRVPKDAYIRLAREYGLTTREKELGFLILSGYSNARIAQELFISETTVKKHVTHIYEKTGVQCRKEFKALFAEAEKKIL